MMADTSTKQVRETSSLLRLLAIAFSQAPRPPYWRQHSVPGLFDTPKEAAIIRASIMKGMKESNGGKLFVPPKQNKEHKPRTKPQPAQPAAAAPPQLQVPLNVTMATPMPMPMWQLPFAAVTPLPMQPFGYVPPRF